MVDLDFVTDPAEFLARAGEYLAADPVLNTVMATVAARARAEDEAGVVPDPTVPRWWMIATEHGSTVGLAMRTAPFRPHPLFVLPMPEEASLLLAQVLHERGEAAGGVNGALPAARLCADEAARLRGGGTVAVSMHTRLFELDELVPPPVPAGRLRPAGENDLELAMAWFEAFRDDADEQAGRRPGEGFEDIPDPEGMLRRIRAGTLWFWLDAAGERVHLTGVSPPAFGVSRIGPVYTPRQQRGRGYASAAVAEVSRSLVESGVRACLYADQANPTSNGIYQAIGYRSVVDMVNLEIRPSSSPG